jgi:hypothetical protein
LTCKAHGPYSNKKSLVTKDSRVLKKALFAGCSKTLRYKALEMPACGKQGEDEGNTVAGGQHCCWRATLLLEGNTVAGRFSAT